MTDYRDEIDDIIDWFDFERVHEVMVFLDWKWGEPGEIPETPELRKRARQILRETCESLLKSELLSTFMETGGFRVTVDRDTVDSSEIYIRLSFELSSWDNYK